MILHDANTIPGHKHTEKGALDFLKPNSLGLGHKLLQIWITGLNYEKKEWYVQQYLFVKIGTKNRR